MIDLKSGDTVTLLDAEGRPTTIEGNVTWPARLHPGGLGFVVVQFPFSPPGGNAINHKHLRKVVAEYTGEIRDDDVVTFDICAEGCDVRRTIDGAEFKRIYLNRSILKIERRKPQPLEVIWERDNA